MHGIGGRSVGLKMVMGGQGWSEALTDDLTWVCWCMWKNREKRCGQERGGYT